MAIQTLSQETINQIAAGEVVERPAHLLKELIENSIDAGATQLEIVLSDGARSVRISDNGVGVEKSDLPRALAPHSTSKIVTFNDLGSLKSYGFRGEALASIGAISQLKFMSRVSHSDSAWSVTSQFGRISEVRETQAGTGTTVEVSQLFENVPARLKFLKTDAAEMTQAKTVIKAMALQNFGVEFKVNINNEMWAYWPRAHNKLERARALFEIENLFDGQAELDGVQVQVVLASPHDVEKHGRNIWIFVQGRWVQDTTVRASLLDAYRNLLMHGEYPIAVIDIKVDPSLVDVNVHPTKSQVKFQAQLPVYRAVQRACRGVLENGPWINNQVSAPLVHVSPLSSNEAFGDLDIQRTQLARKNFAPQYSSIESTFQVHSPKVTIASLERARDVSTGPASENSLVPTTPHFWQNLDVLGQAQMTYILAQSQNSLFLIDQHAAHERVMFETLMEQSRQRKFEQQNFLLPLVIKVDPAFVEKWPELNLDLLGVDLEVTGPEHVQVLAAPTMVSEKALCKIIESISSDVDRFGDSVSAEKWLGEIFATMACHSAIRAGQALSREQMQTLLKDMDRFSLSSFCPHGRPVYIEKKFGEIEREFGRIQ